MKNNLYIILIFLFLLAQRSLAVNYYISDSNGSDSNDGLTSETAWKTFSSSKYFALNGGDTVFFFKNDTFNIAAKYQMWGKDGIDGNNIVLTSYGNGEKPVISGWQTLSGFNVYSGNIYRVTTTIASDLNVVTIDGVDVPMGKWPNSGFATFESHSGTTEITDNELPSSPDFTGAEIVLNAAEWRLERLLISDHTNQTLTFSSSPVAIDQDKYFIQKSINTLDQHGEWFCDGSYFYIYLDNSPVNYIIKAAAVDRMIDTGGGDYWTFDGLTIEGFNDYAIYATSGINSEIKNCDFKFIGGKAVVAGSATGIQITNNNIFDVHGFGFDILSNNAIIRNNDVKRIGLLPGMTDNVETRALCFDANNVVCERNIIDSVAWSGIWFRGDTTVIRENLVSNYNLILNDGGGIYTSGSTSEYRIIRKNIVIQLADYSNLYNTIPLAFGIYLDDNTTDAIIDSNTVINASYAGLYIHNADNNNANNNLLYNSLYGLMIQTDAAPDPNFNDVTGNNFSSNIIYQKLGKTIRYRIYRGVSSITDFNVINNNIYIHADGDYYYTYDYNVGTVYDEKLSEYSTRYSLDVNSTLQNATPTLYYNATTANDTILTGYSGTTATGTFSNGIVLEPFTSSVVLDSTLITPPAPQQKSIYPFEIPNESGTKVFMITF